MLSLAPILTTVEIEIRILPLSQFLEELSQKVESEEERQLCHATAQEYRVSAHNYQQRIERNEATVGEMGSTLNPFSAATA